MAIHFGAEMGEIDLKMDKPFLSRTKAGVQSLFFPGLPEKDRDHKNRSTPVRETVLHKTGKKPDFRDYRQNVHDPGKAVKDPLSGEHRSNATVHLHTGAGSDPHRTEPLWYNLLRNHKCAVPARFWNLDAWPVKWKSHPAFQNVISVFFLPVPLMAEQLAHMIR